MIKEQKISWKEILAGGIIVIVILIFLGMNSGGESSKSEIKTIKIKGMGEVNTIATPIETIVHVDGMGAEAHFTSTSNPKEIYLDGMNSIAYLCKGIHFPITQTSGMGAKVIYREC